MRCSKCEFDNPAGMKFCGKCRTPLGLTCPNCSFENPPGFDFCGQCATALHGDAGTGKSTAAGPAVTTSPAPEPGEGANRERSRGDTHIAERMRVSFAIEPPLDGERKTVTALFADIKGSTELMEELDPEDARGIVDPALKLMIDAVRRYDGYVVQSTGDGIFALFGAPLAHEDHPQRALYAALRLQEDLKRYSTKVLAEGGTPIQGRVGINTGEVVVRTIQTGADQVEYTPIGHTTNLAARMQTAAPVGSIAVSEATRKLCEGYFILKPLGATRVKGVSEPVNVYEVTGLGPLRTRLQRAAGRGLTKFVGRELDMEALRHAAELAKSGRGQIVAAMAEAGVGKSRLFFEFKATSQAGWMVLETFSVSHGKASAFLPIIDLLRNYFRIAKEDDERTRREKVAGRIAILDRSLEETLPYVYSLVGIAEGGDVLAQMDQPIKKRRTLEAIKRIILRESLNQPLMVVFEDLHWIDEETQALLNLLADSIGTAKVLLLVNYRPEYSHQWGSKTYYTQLRLDPLGQESAEEMLSALLGTSPAPATQSQAARRERTSGDLEVAGRVTTSPAPERSEGAHRERSRGDTHVAERVRAADGLEALKRLIIDKTEGNPFFMEEMVQALFEQGALVRNGALKLTTALNEIRVPSTVQALLASRIDRLPSAEKELLQTLAVIGREFSLRLVQDLVTTSDEELERMLTGLQLAEFIYEQPAPGGVEYTFKHALTQEVAYHSVLVEQRRVLHGRIGATIERLFADRLDDYVMDLAHHYDRSSNLNKAIDYLGRAGRRAVEQTAHSEALAFVTRALELITRLPDSAERANLELELQITLSLLQRAAVGPASPENEKALVRALELCEQIGDSRRIEVMLSLGVVRWSRSEPLLALQQHEKALALAEQAKDVELRAAAHYGIGVQLFMLGQFEQSRAHVEGAIELLGSRPIRKFGWVAGMLQGVPFQLARTLLVLGYPTTALKRGKDALDAALRLSDPYMNATALSQYLMNYLVLRDVPAVARRVEELAAILAEHDIPIFHAHAQFYRAWLVADAGRVEEGIVEMRQSITWLLGESPVVEWLVVAMAEVCCRNGLPDQGLAAIDEALPRSEKVPWLQAEFYRLKGELTLLKDPRREAEADHCLRQAIDIAHRQAARLFELRATMSLARLLDKRGHRDEARTMLAAIYGWFTEGFDTADLKDAKTLLDELSL